MPKKFRILLWFLVALFVTSVALITISLTSVSPLRGEFSIETVTIAAQSQTPVRMTWRDFICESGSGFDRCTVSLPSGDLAIEVFYEKYADAGWNILGYQATHGGENVVCDGMLLGSSIGGVRFLGSIQIMSDLKLTREQLQTLQQENWFAQWNQSDPIWFITPAGLAIAAGILSCLLLWQYPSRPAKVLTAITIGFSSFCFLALLPYFILWSAGVIAYLSKLPYPRLTQLLEYARSQLFGLFTHWSVSSFGLTIFGALGVIATVATLAMFWRRTERRISPMFVIMGGMSTFFLFSVLATSFLIAYGFVQADY